MKITEKLSSSIWPLFENVLMKKNFAKKKKGIKIGKFNTRVSWLLYQDLNSFTVQSNYKVNSVFK